MSGGWIVALGSMHRVPSSATPVCDVKARVALLWCRSTTRLGRRGGFLTIFGLAHLLIALSLLVPMAPVLRPKLLHEQLPIGLRVALWTTAGLVGLAAAWTSVTGRDGPGFVALCLMPIERAVSYGLGSVQAILFPGQGYLAGWPSALVWSLLAASVMLAATWPEPPAPFRQSCDAVGQDGA